MESSKQVEAVKQLSESNIEVCVPRKEKIFRCFSQLLVEQFSYTWKIFDFNEIPFISGYPIYSPNFIISKKTDSLWQIAMTKHTYHKKRDGFVDNDEGDISCSEDDDSFDHACDCRDLESKEKVECEKTKRIGFRLLKFSENNVWDVVRYTFTVKTSEEKTISTTEREEPGQVGFSGVPIYAFLSEKDLKDCNLFDEKYLEVTCNITYSYVDNGRQESPVAYDGKQFVPDLRVLFISNKFSDLLVTVDDEVYQTHKVVLHASAPGLGKLLEDSDKPVQKFDLGLDPEVGKAMVNFIYCGKIDDGFPLEKCAALHEAAKRYGVDCLEQYCSNYFKNNLPAGPCRECLGIDKSLEVCLESIKNLSMENIKRALSKEACPHKAESKQ